MVRYLSNRFISILFTILLVITITFLLMHGIPGGPFDQMTENITPEAIAAMNARYNLDKPLHIQYFMYLSNILKGDFGNSFYNLGVSVNDIINQSFPVSARVGIVSVIFIIFVGFTFGSLYTLNNKIINFIIDIYTTIGTSIPNYVIATVILFLLSNRLSLIPSVGLSTWKHYIGPVLTISFFPGAFLTKIVHNSLVETISTDYIRNCKLNGLSNYYIFKHIITNALMPILSYLGPTVASVLTGSFVTEKVFTIPGMGKYFVDSISNRDYPVLMGITLFYSIIVIFIVFITDIIFAIIDPRIRKSKW